MEDDKEAWFDRLLIDYNFQNRGFGKIAFSKVVDLMFSKFPIDKIYLSVYKENSTAIELYQKLGASLNGKTDINGELIMKVKRK